MVRFRLQHACLTLGVVVVLSLAACGGSDGGSSAGASTEAAAAAGAAPCTKAALQKALNTPTPESPIKVLMFACDKGWASGAILVGPPDSEDAVEAAFLARDDAGAWVVPKNLPCDDTSIPAKILDSSPCKVS